MKTTSGSSIQAEVQRVLSLLPVGTTSEETKLAIEACNHFSNRSRDFVSVFLRDSNALFVCYDPVNNDRDRMRVFPLLCPASERFQALAERAGVSPEHRSLSRMYLAMDERPTALALRPELIGKNTRNEGAVIVSRGLLDEMVSDDEIASAIAHEMGHIQGKRIKTSSVREEIRADLYTLDVASNSLPDYDPAALLQYLRRFDQSHPLPPGSLAASFRKSRLEQLSSAYGEKGFSPRSVSGTDMVLKELRQLSEHWGRLGYSTWPICDM